MARRIPWADIKREYVQGTVVDGKRVYPSVRDLASKFHVSLGTLGTRASKEQWGVEREVFANRVETETKQKTIEALSDEGSALDLAAFAIAQAGLARIGKAVIGEPGKEHMPLGPEDINKLSSAAERFHKMGRLALGESTGKEDGKFTVEFVSGEDSG